MSSPRPAFATDSATAAYYELLSADLDEWYTNEGRFAGSDRPGWQIEVEQLVAMVARLSPARTLDIACGTGFLTRHLRGFVVGLDQSPSMVAVTQSRLPDGLAFVGDALHPGVADRSFDRVFTGHFYGHLPVEERDQFLVQARRIAGELVVVDAAMWPGVHSEQWEDRVLKDGSRFRVYKRYLSGKQLASEIGGDVLMDGKWFVAASVIWG